MLTPELSIEVEAPFRYLWLKYVTGVNLNIHCAGGLKGKYSTEISNKTKSAEMVLDEHEAKAYYLCGVSTPYNWAKNFHLAFISAPGSSLLYESNGIAVNIKNVQRVQFEEYNARMQSQSEKRDRKEFYTCRNWIFANYALKNNLL